jgi:hypothetical protein
MSFPTYGEEPRRIEMTEYLVDGLKIELGHEREGHIIKIGPKEFIVHHESLYDNDRPINKRNGQAVYVSELDHFYPDITEEEKTAIVKVLKQHLSATEPDCFIEVV